MQASAYEAAQQAPRRARISSSNDDNRSAPYVAAAAATAPRIFIFAAAVEGREEERLQDSLTVDIDQSARRTRRHRAEETIDVFQDDEADDDAAVDRGVFWDGDVAREGWVGENKENFGEEFGEQFGEEF